MSDQKIYDQMLTIKRRFDEFGFEYIDSEKDVEVKSLPSFPFRDYEALTSLYYYGARYLDPTGAMWLSVDPLFEKYAGMCPYNYCAGNPVKFVDPDGTLLFIKDGEKYIQYIPDRTEVNSAKTEFAQKAVKSLNFLYENGDSQTREVISVLSTHISEVKDNIIQPWADNHFNERLEIEWNPELALKTDNGYCYTPAESLYHELVHAYFDCLAQDDDTKSILGKPSDVKWETLEDELIIKYYETPLSIKLGKFKPTETHPYVRDSYKNCKNMPEIIHNPTKNTNHEN